MKTYSIVSLFVLSALTGFSQSASTLDLARKQYQDENYTEALKLLDKAGSEEPANALVPYLTSHVYLDLSNYKQSVSFMEKAISMDSTRNNWIYECGLIYYAIPDYKRSLQYIRLAGTKGYGRTTDYLENLANAYVNMKQYAPAVDAYQEILKKKPSDQEIQYQLAQAYFNLARYQEAMDTWDKVLSADKTNAEALYMIGLCYQKQGDKAKGQQLCDKAIQMDPSLASKKKTMGGSL